MARMCSVLLVSSLFFVITNFNAWAQDTSETLPDYEAWQELVQRVERAIDAGRASDNVFESVRTELSEFRQLFLEAQDVNSARISRLQSQLDALGNKPETGEEPPEIAERRLELNQELQRIRAPSIAAQEAYNLANGLIGEIDDILVQRRTTAIFELGSTPLNVNLWPSALTTISNAVQTITFELRQATDIRSRQDQLRDNLPIILFFLVIATLLIMRGNYWSERFGEFMRGIGGRGTGVWGFLVSLGKVALPTIGLIFLTQALFLTGMVGSRSALLVENLPQWGAMILFISWLCSWLFSRIDDEALIQFPLQRRTELRYYGIFLALGLVTRELTLLLLEIEDASFESVSIIGFPVLAFTSLVLFRMSIILAKVKNYISSSTLQHDTSSGLINIVQLLGRLAVIIAVISPLMGALGYTRLADAILYPTIWSLSLLGLVAVLQSFFSDVYGWISGRGEEGRKALIPVLIGFMMVLLSLPLFALIWGARVSEIKDIWLRLNEGIAFGEVRISSTDFLVFVIIFVIGYMITRFLKSTLRWSLLPKTNLDLGSQTAIVSGVGYVGIFISALVAIAAAGINLSSIAIVAGALSVGIGFGLQNIVSNFVSGIILLIERPISEGDWIEVNGNMGHVRNISVRSTQIETFDRTDVIVPNADLVSGMVTNYTRGNTVGRVIVPVGVAYGTDSKKVEQILREVAESHPKISKSPPPGIIFQGFGADSLDFEIRAILDDVNWILMVKSDLNHEINRRFSEEGIEIPFSQRDIWLRNPEALRDSNMVAND
ncbi:MAG: DUF3772 domain-containing protein [Aestuariivita sp.]|nr:DUF3772 domain-containing protein [Aestuariivita sp.]